jgi:hypothetical protein
MGEEVGMGSCRNCKYLNYSDDSNSDGHPGPNAGYWCDKVPGIDNLKHFPFKKEMKCHEPSDAVVPTVGVVTPYHEQFMGFMGELEVKTGKRAEQKVINSFELEGTNYVFLCRMRDLRGRSFSDVIFHGSFQRMYDFEEITREVEHMRSTGRIGGVQ